MERRGEERSRGEHTIHVDRDALAHVIQHYVFVCDIRDVASTSSHCLDLGTTIGRKERIKGRKELEKNKTKSSRRRKGRGSTIRIHSCKGS